MGLRWDYTQQSAQQRQQDQFLVQSLSLPDAHAHFQNGYAQVNGITLHYVHYVVGGNKANPPLVLLPGWPETWWHYHKIMPSLAQQFRVIVVDLRGMGGSDKPTAGYDKKTMASDVYQLMLQLGCRPRHRFHGGVQLRGQLPTRHPPAGHDRRAAP